MGFALAEVANRLGAAVTLVTGPVQLETPAGVNRIDVETASDMHAAVHSALNEVDLFIGAAAVCDMRPASVSEQKLKSRKIICLKSSLPKISTSSIPLRPAQTVHTWLSVLQQKLNWFSSMRDKN